MMKLKWASPLWEEKVMKPGHLELCILTKVLSFWVSHCLLCFLLPSTYMGKMDQYLTEPAVSSSQRVTTRIAKVSVSLGILFSFIHLLMSDKEPTFLHIMKSYLSVFLSAFLNKGCPPRVGSLHVCEKKRLIPVLKHAYSLLPGCEMQIYIF